MLCCMRTADVDWPCDLVIVCYGDLLEGRMFNDELYETIMFIRLFNGADLKVQIIYRRARNDNAIKPGHSKERSFRCFLINVCINVLLN
jgi:hypothetical protein